MAGLVLVPATVASAGHHSAAKIRLGRVPLQTAQLGPAGASLPLAFWSGPILSDGQVHPSSGGFIFLFGHGPRGLIGGYALDYGDPYTGGTGVMEIRSSVEEYKTRADAAKQFASLRREGRYSKEAVASPLVTVTEKRVKPVPVGQLRFGYLVTQAAPGLNPIVRLDEQVDAGRFLLDLTVTAGSAGAAKKVAPHLLRVLHHRLQLVLEGHAPGTRPPRGPEAHVGQAPGGPDLSTMILQPTDVGQSHAINLFQSYTADPPALSSFFMDLEPAGPYTSLGQVIDWWPSATEATYAETYGSYEYGSPSGTPVDLSAVGDNAKGYLDTEYGSVVGVVLTNGQAGEQIFAFSDATLKPSDVQSLAQAAADRLDAGLGP